MLHLISNCVYMVYTWYTASQQSRHENSFPEWLEMCSSNKVVPHFPLLYLWFQWQPGQHAGRATARPGRAAGEPTAAVSQASRVSDSCQTGTLLPTKPFQNYLLQSTCLCQLPQVLHKSCQDLDQDNKTDFDLSVLTRNGRLQGNGRFVSLCCWLPLCYHSSHKGWDVTRAFCLFFGEQAFTAAGKSLVKPPTHTIQ